MKDSELNNLWKVVKLCLNLSHGQASVEKGFSINKEVMDTNMKALTLKSKRLMIDHLLDIGGIEQFLVSKELLTACSSARKR